MGESTGSGLPLPEPGTSSGRTRPTRLMLETLPCPGSLLTLEMRPTQRALLSPLLRTPEDLVTRALVPWSALIFGPTQLMLVMMETGPRTDKILAVLSSMPLSPPGPDQLPLLLPTVSSLV